jgi:hypothetical protein
LFENRYHAVLVDVDEYFLELLRYIHLNPVRAGISRHPDEYRWSSHDIYSGQRRASWVTTSLGLSLFHAQIDRARAAYREFVTGAVLTAQPTANPREPRILGDDAFLERLLPPAQPPERHSLDNIANEVCTLFGITLDELVSARRRSDLSRARDLLSARAIATGVASLTETARFLRRSVAAISRAAARGQQVDSPTRFPLDPSAG